MVSLPPNPLKITHLKYFLFHFLGFSLNEVYKALIK